MRLESERYQVLAVGDHCMEFDLLGDRLNQQEKKRNRQEHLYRAARETVGIRGLFPPLPRLDLLWEGKKNADQGKGDKTDPMSGKVDPRFAFWSLMGKPEVDPNVDLVLEDVGESQKKDSRIHVPLKFDDGVCRESRAVAWPI